MNLLSPQFPLPFSSKTHHNLSIPALYEYSLAHKETQLTQQGALVATTGVHTGRSPKDKFIVDSPAITNTIWWEKNNKMTPTHFSALKQSMLDYASNATLFVQDLYCIADPKLKLHVRVVTEFAWQAIFISHLLIKPTEAELAQLSQQTPNMLIVDLAHFKSNPDQHKTRTSTVIALDIPNSTVLIGGTEYAGEIKKSVFSLLNYHLVDQGIMPMHCSANVDLTGNNAAVFFGLSGTGKTTLSTSEDRLLIGDDEHGWSHNGLFNFEGGCYAKMINLSPINEPAIYQAVNQFGSILENVVLNPNRTVDYSNKTLTENTRGAYPIQAIGQIKKDQISSHPKHIIMLTADAFGILPPLAKLKPEQALYYFISGYTAKVSGTEKGVTEPEPTFSACFGQPFMPRNPIEYANLLQSYLHKHQPQCWLLNTGWFGGPFGVGQRFPIPVTRALLKAILNQTIQDSHCEVNPYFGFLTPKTVQGVDSVYLNPQASWSDSSLYDTKAKQLVSLFVKNFEPFYPKASKSLQDHALLLPA